MYELISICYFFFFLPYKHLFSSYKSTFAKRIVKTLYPFWFPRGRTEKRLRILSLLKSHALFMGFLSHESLYWGFPSYWLSGTFSFFRIPFTFLLIIPNSFCVPLIMAKLSPGEVSMVKAETGSPAPAACPEHARCRGHQGHHIWHEQNPQSSLHPTLEISIAKLFWSQ